MAESKITVNVYDVPNEIDRSNVITAAVRFNTDVVESYSKMFISSDSTVRCEISQNIESSIKYIHYIVYFLFEKTSTEDAHIFYSLSNGDYDIIVLDQTYSSLSELISDMDYINIQIESIFD